MNWLRFDSESRSKWVWCDLPLSNNGPRARNQWKHSRAINVMLALLLAWTTTTTRCPVISFRSQIQYNTIQYNIHTQQKEKFFYNIDNNIELQHVHFQHHVTYSNSSQ
mmetsp:Transcript_3375/g.3588  ORF Transcript_3375/g.3588 Transcript_3375/m.3588 type:complete len:108 (-) Transcript_3375:7-330(-)